MNPIRSILAAACVAALTAPAGAQGITEIMRSGSAPQRSVATPSQSYPQQRPPTVQSANGQQPAEFIVALVNSQPITNTEVQTRLTRVVRENPEARQVPIDQLVRVVLERLINERAQLQLAKEQGIKIDDLAVDQAEQSVARQNSISVPELRRRVEADGLGQKQFRSDLRDQLTLTRLRDREIEQKVKISDTEVDQFIKEQRAGANAAFAPDINIAQLLVIVPPDASDADVAKLEDRAQSLAKRARAGEDFANLVRDNSDAADRGTGGVLGMRSADKYPPPFVEATQGLAPGAIVGPIRTSAGFHVLKLIAKSQPGATDTVYTQTDVRHIILLNDPKRTTAQAVAQLAEFKERIAKGTADFASLARDNSQDASAKEGGELGWSRPGQFVPEFEEAMNRLPVGAVSDPVVTRFGVHLIQVEGRREGKLTQSEQREAVRTVLREKKIEQATETWTQEVRARAYVEYREAPQS